MYKECYDDVMSSYTVKTSARKKKSQEKKKQIKEIEDSEELYTVFVNSKQDAHEFSAQLSNEQKEMFNGLHAQVQQQIKER